MRPLQLPQNEITRSAIAPIKAPAPMPMIPAGEAKGGDSFKAAIMMPHTRKPPPAPISSTEKSRQINGFHAPQINNPIEATAMMMTPDIGPTARNANNM